MGVLYEHWRLDTNECFYVGISWSKEDVRPYDYTPRNYHHGNIINRLLPLGLIETRIQVSGESKEILCELEKLQIQYWRSFIGRRLTNVASGGEGGQPFNPEDETYRIFCEAVKNGHAARSRESKELSVKKRLETLSAQPKEKKKESSERRSIAIKKGYAKLSEEEKQIASKNKSIASKKAHANKTQAEKKAFGEAIRRGKAESKTRPGYIRPLKYGRIFYAWWLSNVKNQHYWGC